MSPVIPDEMLGSGSFLSAKTLVHSVRGVISASEIMPGKWGNRVVLTVVNKSGPYKVALNLSSQSKLVSLWGRNTDKWLKKIVVIEKAEFNGKEGLLVKPA